MTQEPPLAPPPGSPLPRSPSPRPPAVRDVPLPATPPRVRILPPTEPQPTAAAAGTLCPVDPPLPMVSIKVRVPACAVPGEELTYRICVENRGGAAAHHVQVRNPLPANATFVRADPPPASSDPVLEWRLGTLDCHACKEITLVLKPTGSGDIQNCARVQFEHGECVLTKVGNQPAPSAPAAGQPRLQVRKTGPAQAILYQPINFRLVVTNSGNAEARNIRLTDRLPEGMQESKTDKRELTWDVGTLGPGESRAYDYQAITKKSGRLCNRAVVTDGTQRDEVEACVEVGEAKLTIQKSGPEAVFFKTPAKYQITVTNAGLTPLTNIVVADLLPGDTKVVQMSEGGQLRAGQVEWLLGTLAPGSRRSIQLVLQATKAGKITNKATARADGVEEKAAEFTTDFESRGGLTFYIEPPENPVTVSTPTRYTITVVNQGAAAVEDVDLEAAIPEQMKIGQVRPEGAQILGANVRFSRLAKLEGGQQASFTIEVTPQKPAGDAAMKATLRTKDLPQGVSKEARTNIVPNGEPPTAR
jgi:uncharacterized repeat protein (TIGR01451 family)